jgi:hypothetical protein
MWSPMRLFFGVAVVPLMGVDAEGGAGFAVAEAVLDLDDAVSLLLCSAGRAIAAE